MEATMKDEFFDDALCKMINFEDVTATNPKKRTKTEKIQNLGKPEKEKKTAYKRTDEPVDVEYEPVWMFPGERFFNCIKWPVVFIGLEYLVSYWQQTGQMQESAAMPSMIVCALLAGISVGKNWKWKS